MNPQYVILFHHFRELLKRAATAGIQIMPLKGAHLLTSVYGPDEDRGLMADIDFLVPEAQWTATLDLMHDYGFTPRPSSYDETVTKEQGFNLDVGTAYPILFEAHRQITEPKRFFIDVDGIWKRARESTFDGVPCFRMADEDLFCHVAWHAAFHRLMSIARAKTDLVRLMNNADIDMKLIVERAQEWRVTRAVWLFLQLIKDEVKKNGTYAESLSLLHPPFYIAEALGFVVGSNHHTRIISQNHRVQAAILWPLLFDSKRQLVRAILHHPLSPL